MNAERSEKPDRLDVIEALLSAAAKPPGRTAIMKCLFFLQEVEGVPLGYRFDLYTYGPYASEVLADLGFAEQIGRIRSELVTFPSGNEGYIYTPASKSASRPLDPAIQDKVERIARHFAGRSAAELETASTIVFVDRYHARAGRPVDEATLVRQVRAIKPHLTEERIREEIGRLRGLRWLTAPVAAAA